MIHRGLTFLSRFPARLAMGRTGIVEQAEWVKLQSQRKPLILAENATPLAGGTWARYTAAEGLDIMRGLFNKPSGFPTFAGQLVPLVQTLVDNLHEVVKDAPAYEQVVVHDFRPSLGHNFLVCAQSPVLMKDLLSPDESSSHDAIATRKMTWRQIQRLVSRYFPGEGLQPDGATLDRLRKLIEANDYDAVFEGIGLARSNMELRIHNQELLRDNQSVNGPWMLGRSIVFVREYPLHAFERGFIKGDCALTTRFHVFDGGALRLLVMIDGKPYWVSWHVGQHPNQTMDWVNPIVAAKAFPIAFQRACWLANQWPRIAEGLGDVNSIEAFAGGFAQLEHESGLITPFTQGPLTERDYATAYYPALVNDARVLGEYEEWLGPVSSGPRYLKGAQTAVWPKYPYDG